MTFRLGQLRRSKPKVLIAVVAAAVMTAPGCTAGTSTLDDAGGLVAAVASYDLVAQRPGRFMVGLYTADQSRTLAYGTVSFAFTYLGTGEAGSGGQAGSGPVEASYLPIPGQDLDSGALTGPPEPVAGSVATGVYAAQDVIFATAGFWEVTVTAETDGETVSTSGAFEVLATSDLPSIGDPAPSTRQPLAGDPNVDPKAIDSRAGGETPIPDPELHDITVADAIAKGRPVMIVVSTPTFCVSRFCGPITDSVHDLALQYGDRMEFVHLEVWRDFEANQLNPSAAEWIAPTPDTQGGEPWVFVVDAEGIIVQRFDNVASEPDLLAAVENLLATTDQ
ncbi:MAG: TlpA family protein disulfide reductase [Acidimicrobiia bacterium]